MLLRTRAASFASSCQIYTPFRSIGCNTPFQLPLLLTARMASTGRQQPPWRQPEASVDAKEKLPPLKIFNSLTKSKELFVPADST